MKVGGKVVCESQQIYAKRAGYTSKPMANMPGMNAGHSAMPGMPAAAPPSASIKSEASVKHISDTAICTDFGTVKAGDKMELDALYDTKKNGLNKLMGEFVELMGVSVVYVAAA